MIYLDHISVQKDKTLILDDITGQFKEGSMTAIIGPNGAGKSTLLHTLLGLNNPTSGSVNFTFPRSDVGFLPQQTQIEKDIPIQVYDFVALGFLGKKGLFKAYTPEEHQTILQAIHTVGLTEHQNKMIVELSGGQFQRALFARLILKQPKVIILDEPFAGIDEPTQEALIQLLAQWHQAGKTILAVLHQIKKVQSFFEYTLWLNKQVLAWDTTSKVLEHPEFNSSELKGCHHVI